MIIAFAGPSAPSSNWLICDGTAYAQSAYPALYAVIGTYWGAGSGGLQFQVPDLRGRSALGYVNTPVGGITARAFASKGGEEYHVLSTGELASHNHSVTDGSHNHGATDSGHTHGLPTTGGVTYGGGGTLRMVVGPAVVQTDVSYASITVGYSGANISVNNNGGNAGHNTMMPFAVCYYLIKAV